MQIFCKKKTNLMFVLCYFIHKMSHKVKVSQVKNTCETSNYVFFEENYLHAAAAMVPPISAPASAPIEMAAGTGVGSTTTTGAGGGGQG